MFVLDKHAGRRGPVRARRVEQQYAYQLTKVAEQVGNIIKPYPLGMESVPKIEHLLDRYAELLSGWASQTASNMLFGVAKREELTWESASRAMSAQVQLELRHAPTGQVLKSLLGEQVSLIKSIPRDAAKRVHRLALESIENSSRATEIAKEMQRSGEVSTSQAKLIARTETARAATNLTQARAQHIGSTHFIWRASSDSDTRPEHRMLNGQSFAWDDPPVADERSGTRALPGCIWNCRCWPEPIIPF